MTDVFRTRAVELPLFVRSSQDVSTPAEGGDGLARSGPESARPPAASRMRVLAEVSAALAAIDLLTLASSLWLAQVASLAILLLLPGFLVLRAAGMSLRAMTRSPGWLPTTSLVALTVVGLATNAIGPLIGVAQPLRTGPILVALNLTCLALALVAAHTTPLQGIRALVSAIEPRSLALLSIPVLAGLGALRLNSGRGSLPAIVAAAAAVTALVVAFWRANRWSTRQLSWVLFASSTAGLLGFSLRSAYVFGWDISAEYGLMHGTFQDGVWHAAHPGDAYGAMLSLTVLPASIHAITGMSALALLKLVYPALFGLFPVITFALLRMALPTRSALLGASLLLTQAPFLREMPALGRQELAFLAYGSLLAAMLDRRLARRAQVTLLVLMSFGVTVFHYSTNYTLVTMLMLAVLVEFVLSFRLRSRRVDPRKALALALTLVLGVVWYAGITRSTRHAVNTASELLQSGLQILPNAEAGQNPIQAFLKGNVAKPLTVPEYQSDVASDYAKSKPWVVKTPDATDPKWDLTAPPTPAPTSSGGPFAALTAILGLLIAQLVNGLTVVGSLALILQRRLKRPLLDFAVLAVPSLVLLVLVRLSGSLASFYNQERLLMQLLPVVAVPILWLLGRIREIGLATARRAGHRTQALAGRLAPMAIAGLLGAVVFQIISAWGLVLVAQGDRTSSNFFNSGENFERFYVTTPEVAAAKWLAQNEPEGAITYTDLYGELRLFAYGKVKGALLTDITPETVDVNSWVYGSRANIVGGRARAYIDAGSIVYVFPRAFLENQLGVVYSNGTAEIFHR